MEADSADYAETQPQQKGKGRGKGRKRTPAADADSDEAPVTPAAGARGVLELTCA